MSTPSIPNEDSMNAIPLSGDSIFGEPDIDNQMKRDLSLGV